MEYHNLATFQAQIILIIVRDGMPISYTYTEFNFDMSVNLIRAQEASNKKKKRRVQYKNSTVRPKELMHHYTFITRRKE